MSSSKSYVKNIDALENDIKGKSILIIAPGESCVSEKNKIISALENGSIPISINFDYRRSNN